MGQLLAILVIPPLVGIITYAVFRFIWQKDDTEAAPVVTTLRSAARRGPSRSGGRTTAR